MHMTELTETEKQVGRVAVGLVTEGVRCVRAGNDHLDVKMLESLLDQFAEDFDDNDEEALSIILGRVTLVLGVVVGAFAAQLVHDEQRPEAQDIDAAIQHWALKYA